MPLELIDGEDGKYALMEVKALTFNKYYNIYDKKNM
jgi:hypothetical protein